MAWIQKPRTRVGGLPHVWLSFFFSFCVSSDAFCLGLRGFVQTTCWDCDRSQYFPAFLWRQPSCGSRLRREEQAARVIGCAAASRPSVSVSHGLLHNCAHLRALEGFRCGYWECKQHVLLTVDAAAAPRILLTGLLDQSPHNAFTAWAVPLAVDRHMVKTTLRLVDADSPASPGQCPTERMGTTDMKETPLG
ncbi:hypothetical protein HDV62DRAFT_377538 [Trichoderma sp. SZMC 28011]